MTSCDECAMKSYCVARINDSTVTGCNILLVHRGLISAEEFATEHADKGGDRMNDQCLNCRIRKSCYYKEPEEDWTCEHYGYFNGLLGEIDRLEIGGKEVNNEQISEKLNEAEKVIGESRQILNDIKSAMRRDVKKEIAEAYQRGLEVGRNETWEAAKKLSWAEKYGGYGDRLDEVFDRTDTFDFLEYSPNEAIAKLKAYEEQKADDGIDEKITGFLERNNYTVDEVFNRLKRMKGEE